jgi:hypothetical protein
MRHAILVIAGLVAVACGDVKSLSSHSPGNRDAGGECEPGTERCACYGNKTCNDGLVCGSDLCVKLGRADAGDEPPPLGSGGSSGGGYGGAFTEPPRIVDAGSSDGADADSGGSGGRRSNGGASGASGKGGKGGSGGATATGDAGGSDPGNTTPVALFVMLDRSLSMTTLTGTQTVDSWTSAVTAITTFVRDPMSRNVDIGLGTFPVGANNTFDCTAGADCGTPVVPIASVQTNAQPMIDAMSAQKPQSLAFTPTECALRGMINQCLTFMSNSATSEQCVAVLVTDGTPTQCDLDNNNLVAIIADGKAKGVDSFTLGLPGADINVLNQYAASGGTSMAIDVSAGPQAFIAALNAIRGRVTHTMSP